MAHPPFFFQAITAVKILPARFVTMQRVIETDIAINTWRTSNFRIPEGNGVAKFFPFKFSYYLPSSEASRLRRWRKIRPPIWHHLTDKFVQFCEQSRSTIYRKGRLGFCRTPAGSVSRAPAGRTPAGSGLTGGPGATYTLLLWPGYARLGQLSPCCATSSTHMSRLEKF